MAQPEFDDTTLTLTFQFPFHQKRISDPKNTALLIDAIEQTCGAKIKVTCLVGAITGLNLETSSATLQSQADVSTEEKVPIGAIANIFGGAELIES